jgi:hypothetical protein
MSIDSLKAEYEAAPPGKRQAVLGRIYQSLKNAPVAELNAAMTTLLPLVQVPSPNDAADVALVLGALVEDGADPEPLALALLAPLERWLKAAGRFAAEAAELERAPDEANEDDVIELGSKRVAREDVDDLHDDDPEAVASWFSLEVWFRPAVASLTRAPKILAAARQREPLREALASLGAFPGGAYWLRVLFDACGTERLVFLLPEVNQAWELIADGVVDTGQLTVLLSKVLAQPLAELGASGPASEAVLKVMLGQGPQEIDESYSARFYLYPWRAMNPKTQLPEDERFWWTAPGGRGTHSLPADFQPATVERLDGARVFFLVGPRQPTLGHSFVRELGASRMFDQLQARLSEPVALGAQGYERWVARISAALASPTA